MVSGDGKPDGVAGMLEWLGLPEWTIAVFALLFAALLGFAVLSLRRANTNMNVECDSSNFGIGSSVTRSS